MFLSCDFVFKTAFFKLKRIAAPFVRSIETAVVIRDDILGAVPLACSRRPAFYNRIKLPGCVGCLKNSFLKPGAGDQEKALANELAALEG